MTCIICTETRSLDDRQAGVGSSYVCQGHLDRMSRLLSEVARMDALLCDPETLAATVDRDTERWVGSKAPCGLDPIIVTDRRSRGVGAGDPVSPERVLRAWLCAILEARHGYDLRHWPLPRQGMATLVSDLQTHLRWLTCQPTVVRFARHLAAVHRAQTVLLPKG